GVGDFAAPRLDLAVVGFAALVIILTALLFGLAPALHAARAEPIEILKGGGRGSTRSRRSGLGFTAFDALTVSEMALAVVLLIGSGLLLRSLWRLESLSLGFDTSHLMTFQIQAQWYSARDAPVLVERLVD